nr:VOC family protein [Streptomyces himalayensis]
MVEVEDNSALIERLLSFGAVPESLILEFRGRRAWRDLMAVRHPDDPYEEETGTGLGLGLGLGRRILCQRVPEPKTVKNRLHIDVHSAAGQRDAEVAQLEALGAAALIRVKGEWVIMQDLEGNSSASTDLPGVHRAADGHAPVEPLTG